MTRAGFPTHGDSLPSEPRNRNVRCKGRSVIRYKRDEEGHRKDEPILDEDGRRQYRPCEAFGANGTEYCNIHGGSVPSVLNAAKRTLALGADDFAEALKAIATDERVPAETRIKAINSALDRIGIRAGVDVGMETPLWLRSLQAEFEVPSTEDETETEPPVAPTPPAEEAKPEPARAPRARRTTKPKVEW